MIVAMLLLLYVINVHALWIYELLPNNQCGVDHLRRDFEAVVWPWISAIINVYLPLVVVAVLAILVAAGRRGSATSATALSYPDVDDVQLSRICVTVGLVYTVATSPSVILNLLEYFLPRNWQIQGQDQTIQAPAENIYNSFC